MTSTQLVAVTNPTTMNPKLVELGRLASQRNELAIAAQRDSDDHVTEAGKYLAAAKALVRETSGLTWPQYLESCCSKIGRRRADELIMVAEGRTTLIQLRASKAESVRKSRELSKRTISNKDCRPPQWLSNVRLDAAMATVSELDYGEQELLFEALEIIPPRGLTPIAQECLPNLAQRTAAAHSALL
ncbi:hypothetical protein HNQ36_003040 [Afipia massiliensis]|uniref:Uncharacterized protein n=1 Tax=Afipia massiliensis TaxID=211460 RepID=A0A840MXN3_9BRAD|nr:hypothetical protein [Afipia massiliensis]MBB5053049.1 hypothetical protein [Afipia massiliensis]